MKVRIVRNGNGRALCEVTLDPVGSEEVPIEPGPLEGNGPETSRFP